MATGRVIDAIKFPIVLSNLVVTDFYYYKKNEISGKTFFQVLP